MDQHWDDAIGRIDDHVKEVMGAYDGRELTDHIIAELRYLAETVCMLGEADQHAKDAKADRKYGATSTTTNPGVRRGISVK